MKTQSLCAPLTLVFASSLADSKHDCTNERGKGKKQQRYPKSTISALKIKSKAYSSALQFASKKKKRLLVFTLI